MSRIRVHQLAKELGIDSKTIIGEAAKHGIAVKNHMSSLRDSDEFMLRAFLEELKPPPPPKPPEPVVLEEREPVMAEAPELGVAEMEALEPPRSAEEVAEAPPTAVEVEPPVRREVVARPRGAPAVAPVETPAPEYEPMEVVAAAPGEPPVDRDPAPADGAPPEVIAAVGPPGTEEAPAVAETPAGPSDAPPPVVAARSVQAHRTTTATPPKPGDSHVVSRVPPASRRRQAEILGRKEIPRPAAPRADHQRSAPARGGSGSGGSGLIPTRSDGPKRTFVVAGRRGPGRGPGGGRGPGYGRGRDRGERAQMKPRSVNLSATTPDSLMVEMPITVKGLSEKLGVKANILISKLFINHKKVAKINDPLDAETVQLLGMEFECEITCSEKKDVETQVLSDLESSWEKETGSESRAPIVAFLGHVDHGKTSLLDALRKTNVAAREHGGITQHIGATRIELPDSKAITFLDTPGHRAFTEMRARGAQTTDIVVLVVAADDGVMPQTKEAIAHARAASVPIVVALNKIDKADANPMKVKQELATEGLQGEDWGGQIQIIDVSATTGQGMDKLLESLLLESELLELKANPDRPAIATVIEAEQTGGEGNVARLMVNDGTLRKGDIFVCGVSHGRVRAIKGPDAKFVAEAGPSMPVEITGLNEIPMAGDKLYVLPDLATAKEIASKRVQLTREREIAKQSHVSLENLFEKLKGDTLKIILKVDVTGSLEVLQREIMSLTHPEVRPEIIHAAVGGITETDVTLADASDAVILGFHVSAAIGARRLAEEKHVEIRTYQIIYKLIEELRDALEGRLAPEEREAITGELEVRATWKVTRLGTIAGCHVTSGIIKRSSKVRVSRGGIVIFDAGHLDSLKRMKDDAREVKEGFDCGLLIAGFNDFQEGDTITAYEIHEIKRTLEETA